MPSAALRRRAAEGRSDGRSCFAPEGSGGRSECVESGGGVLLRGAVTEGRLDDGDESPVCAVTTGRTDS